MAENIGDEVRRRGGDPACVEWADGFEDWREAWNACPRGDWILWIARQLGATDALQFEAGVCASVAMALNVPSAILDAFRAVLARWRDGQASRDALEQARLRVVSAANTGDAPLQVNMQFPDGTFRPVTPDDLTNEHVKQQFVAGVEAHVQARAAAAVREAIAFDALGGALN